MTNYFNYFTDIEEYFVQKRGRHLLVSPLDWCLIELWKDQGVPLNVVMRGIDRSFATARGKRKRAPATLFYCHPVVMEAFEEYSQSLVGGDTSDSSASGMDEETREEILSFLEHLGAALEGRTEESVPGVRRRIIDLSGEVQRRRDVSPEEIDRALVEIGRTLAREQEDQMTREARKELRKEVRQELRLYRKRLSKEMYERLFETAYHRRLRSEAGLPEFSLLDLLQGIES